MPNHRKLREEQEGPCGWLPRLVRRWRWSRRERNIIRNCGCVTYCPKCHDMLNDQAYWLASNGDGLGTYKCRLCGNVSEWHFGIAPVAVLIYSSHTKDTANGHPCPDCGSRWTKVFDTGWSACFDCRWWVFKGKPNPDEK